MSDAGRQSWPFRGAASLPSSRAGSGHRTRLRRGLSRTRFRRLVRRALDALPPHFSAARDNVVVVVEARPRREDYRTTGRPSGPLFGSYRGTPLPERGTGYAMTTPDVIAIFQRPLMRYNRSRRRLRREIERTVLHEFGHYFGLDEPAVEHL